MERRKYTDEERAAALAALDANAGNVARTAEQLGIPASTLQYWQEMDALPKLREQKKVQLADRLEEIAYQLVEALPGKIKKANLLQTATTLGITIDKMQLLRGLPTNISDDASLTDEQRMAELNRLANAARERQARQAAESPASE